MGFLKSIISGAVDVVLLPVAVTEDVLSLGEAGSTAKRLESAANNVTTAVEDLV